MSEGALAGPGFTLKVQDILWIELLQELSVEASRLDGKVIQMAFLVAHNQDVLLYSLLADQTVDVHLTRLTNPVTPVLSLHRERS